MALIEGEAERAGLSSDLTPLAETENGRLIRVYRFPMDTARPLAGQLRRAYDNTFALIAERYADVEETKYRKHHIPEIAAAVFDRHRRAELLTDGIAKGKRDG